MQEPVLIRSKPLSLYGVSFWGDPFGLSPEWNEGNAIGSLWKRFAALAAQLPPELVLSPGLGYEAHLIYGDDKAKGLREVFAGAPAARGPDGSALAYPPCFSIKTFAACDCLSFTLRGREIVEAWDYLYGEWLPSSPWIEGPWMLEVYGPGFKGLGPGQLEQSEMGVLLPVTPRQA